MAVQTMVDPYEQAQKGALDSARSLYTAAATSFEWAPHLNWGERLAAEGVIRTPAIIKAMSTVKRVDFLPEHMKPHNGANHPLEIGQDQTNSQPSTVGRMLEWLEPKRGQKILDLGSGSAWTTALLAHIVGKAGVVLGIECVPELVTTGRRNLKPYNDGQAKVMSAGKQFGRPRLAPFNRILVSAHLTEPWLEDIQQQLSPRGGRLVAPLSSEESYGGNKFDKDMVVVVPITTGKWWPAVTLSYR